MTRLQEFVKARPAVASFVAAAIAVSAAVTVNHVSRQADGELLSVSQAERIDSRADATMQEMKTVLAGLKGVADVKTAKEFRQQAQALGIDLISTHHKASEGKSGRTPDVLSVYADKIQAKGIKLNNAVSMLRVWEASVQNGDLDRAADARERAFNIVANDVSYAKDVRFGVAQDVGYTVSFTSR